MLTPDSTPHEPISMLHPQQIALPVGCSLVSCTVTGLITKRYNLLVQMEQNQLLGLKQVMMAQALHC
jgi:hypothetical protein